MTKRKAYAMASHGAYEANDPRRVALAASMPATAQERPGVAPEKRRGSGFDFRTANINLLDAYYPFLDDAAQARARRTIAHLAVL